MEATTRYAKSGDVNIAYQVVGQGPIDLVGGPTASRVRGSSVTTNLLEPLDPLIHVPARLRILVTLAAPTRGRAALDAYTEALRNLLGGLAS